jgi:type VI secretion system protein ImpL
MRWLLVVLVALVLLGVWVAAIWLPGFTGIAEAVTAVILLAIALVLLVRWLRARMKAAAIERAITEQASAARAAPEQQAAIIALRADMLRAVRALERQRYGLPRGQSSLYALPWYVIVGPPAVGKTTALEHSGLEFIPSAAGDPKIRGRAGTRNCDWWFSREAILLDTAGRFAVHDEDREEWMAFLDSLRRLRPERPLDGVIVAVSVPDLLSASDIEREQLAAKLRARIEEVLQSLEMQLPAYLLLTKADLVPGFVESWSDLGKPQRGQPWGASFELNDPRLADPVRAIEGELDVLERVLHARLLDRVPRERHPERRKRIMQFPVELRALRSPLARLVESLVRPGAGGEAVALRGFYLTSGTQVGRPVDRVLQGMIAGFELNAGPSAPPPARAEEVQSYFLTDVFRSVILPDRHFATRSTAGTRRRSRRELRVGLASLGVAVFVLLPGMVSYVRNAQLASAAIEAVDRLPEASAAGSVPGTRGDPIEAMLDTLDRMDDQASGFSVPAWFGPRAARELRDPMRRAYVARVRRGLEASVRPRLEKEVDAMATRPLSDLPATPEDRTPLREAYDALRLYTVLVEPVGHLAKASANTSADTREWAAERLTDIWHAALDPREAVDPERLHRHVMSYLDELEQDPRFAWPQVRSFPRARESLTRSGIDALPYRRALLWAAHTPAIRPKDIFDSASLEFLTCGDDCRIPGVYTASGWKEIEPHLAASTPLPAQAVVEPWVVGDASIPADEDALREDILDKYYRDYSAQWMTFLDALTVQRPSSDVARARRELLALKKPDGFYRTLFSQLKNNRIRREPAPPAGVAAVIDQIHHGCQAPWSKLDPDAGLGGIEAPPPPPTLVDRTFRPFLEFAGLEAAKATGGEPPPLDGYIKLLDRLNATLEASEKLSPSDLEIQLADERTGVENLVDGVEGTAKSTLRHLLFPPIEGSVSAGKTTEMGGLSRDWTVSVWHAWQKMAELTPFKASSRAGVDIADFDKFFHPGSGTIWTFVHAKMGDWIEQGGDGSYVVKRGADPLTADFLSCLDVAQEIADAFFPENADPGMTVSIRADWSAPDVSDVKFVAGSKATAIGNDDWATIKWFGEDVSLSWVQRSGAVKWFGERKSFALFDLFKRLGGLTPTTSGDRPIYVLDSPPLTVKVRGVALRPDFFSRLRCPAEITTGKRP